MNTKILLFITTIIWANLAAANEWINAARDGDIPLFLQYWKQDPSGAKIYAELMYRAAQRHEAFRELLEDFFGPFEEGDPFPDLFLSFGDRDGGDEVKLYPELERILCEENSEKATPDFLEPAFQNAVKFDDSMEQDPSDPDYFVPSSSGKSKSQKKTLAVENDEDPEKPFCCPFCPKNKVKRYGRKGDLIYHVKMKHGEDKAWELQPRKNKEDKNFPCPLHTCKCGYVSKRDLKRHAKDKHPDDFEEGEKGIFARFLF